MEESLEIEKWKLKNLIKKLSNLRGEGTSVISYFITPNSQISDAITRLNNEAGTASNIKSHTNKLSVLAAIATAVQKLKLVPKTPPNGLAVYAGNVLVNGKDRKVCFALEPHKPLKMGDYICGNKFVVEPLRDLLSDDQKYGFIIMDGNGALFGRVQGSVKDTLTKFGVNLPKKQKKGGQSAPRFQRQRELERNAYVKKVAETATQVFITNNLINVDGLFLAGSAEFKNDLGTSDLFDQRLKNKVIATVDISYGGESGFEEALEAVKGDIAGMELIKEKEILNSFFLEMRLGTGKFIYGPQETVDALLAGAVKDLILDENLELYYKDETILRQEDDDAMLFTEWITLNYQNYGCKLHFVSGNTGEGAQFIRGFGGMSAILKYQYEIPREIKDKPIPEEEPEDKTSGFNEDDFM